MKILKAAPVGLACCLVLASGAVQPAYAQVDTGRLPTPKACRDRAVAGALGGALVGALIGSAVAGKGQKTEGAVLGGLIGAVAGSQLPKLTKCGKQLIVEGSRQVVVDGRPLRVTADNGQQMDFELASLPYESEGDRCVDVGLTIYNPDGSLFSDGDRVTQCQDYAGGEYNPRTETLPFSG